MPDEVSHPGVFIEESPAGHPIAGVATSITAFLGRAAMGPTDKPASVFDLADYIDQFGALDLAYPMGFAVRDFFANGGSHAVIVRLYTSPSAGNAAAVLTAGSVHPVTLVAASPGDWANGLEAQVKHDGDAAVAAGLGLTPDDLFSLRVRTRPGGPQEKFSNLTVKDTARRIDRVLARESALVRIADPDALVERPGESVDGAGTATWEHVQPSDVGHPGAPLDLAGYAGDRAARTGKYQLAHVDLVNLVCVSPNSLDDSVPPAVYQDILDYCVERRAFLLVDPPADWTRDDLTGRLSEFHSTDTAARNAAIFYPRLLQQNPLRGNQVESFAACGAVAGAMARTDSTHGVWKAPAGTGASLAGIVGLAEKLSDAQSSPLNQNGINVIRAFPTIGPAVWGARTMRGADVHADEFKYIAVRRTALFIEESLLRGLQWVVFEPNDERLWTQIRGSVGDFMNTLFRQGAFQGQTPRDAYFVDCGRTTMTADDIDNGVVNVVVGFAPLKPSEFVILQLHLIAGQKGPP